MKLGCEDRRPVKPGQSPPKVTATGIRKSTASRWRAAVLGLVNLFMVAHVIQWWITGRTVSPIEPSETMHTLQRGAVNAGFIFFSLAILATLIFGRFVCGWGCHILALQDFCAWLLKKMGITPKAFRSRLLIYVPLIAALYMFVYPTVYRFFVKPPSEALLPTFTNHLITTNFWETFPSVAVAIPFLFICGFMTVYFLGQKGFCTYACPYGGFFGLADKLAPGKIRVTDACNQCGHCTATCTSNVLVHAEVRDYKMVVDPGCMKCMDCISVCPNDALYFGFGLPTIVSPQPKAKPAPRKYSLTWPEEIVGALVYLASFLAVRGVYALVPFLMALGCAAVTTFLFLKTWRLFRTSELSFHRLILKSSGKIRKAGWAFLIFAVLWIGLNAHCGWVRYHEYRGDQAFQRIQIPDELALAEGHPGNWLTPPDRENAESGKDHLRKASDIGFFVNAETAPKLAWFEYLTGDSERATAVLETAAKHQKGQAKAISLYYRGTILNRLGRYDEALDNLDASLREREDLILARQEKGEALWQLGRKEQAMTEWADALIRNRNLALVGNQLAAAERALGKIDEANAHENQADQATPDDPLYHWMLGLRLKALAMSDLAEKHFQRAIQLDPSYQSRPR